MVEIKTTSGFKCKLDENVVDNMELVDALAEMQGEDDILAISKVLTLLLGKNKQALYDHIRTKDGRVPVSDISREIKEIFGSFGDNGKK